MSKIYTNSQWKLTLPVEGKPGKPKEIYSPFEETPGCFEILDNNVLRMSAAIDGFHTINSSYPRSEFRELGPDGGLAGWDPSTGFHEMKWSAAVDELPPKKSQVVVGQIHDEVDDVIMIRHSSAKMIEVIQDTNHYGVVDDNYTLGEVYNCGIRVENGIITITYEKNGKVSPPVVVKATKSVSYFKMGCYTQSNLTKEPTKQGRASVRILSVTVSHGDSSKGSSLPSPPKDVKKDKDDKKEKEKDKKKKDSDSDDDKKEKDKKEKEKKDKKKKEKDSDSDDDKKKKDKKEKKKKD